MNTKSRIASVGKGISLDASITGVPTFHLAQLQWQEELDFPLPTNIRLGHLAEKIVSGCIKASIHYKVLYEQVQILENQKTIGEIDFILENQKDNQLLHVELAYKFYLYDPSISTESLQNWIGPNRNDSLIEKLDKLKSKQFPLLYHSCTAAALNTIDIARVAQVLCLVVSLFVPYGFKTKLAPAYEKAIKGYYLNFETFKDLDAPEKGYYIPSKKEWGMDACEQENWSSYQEVANQIQSSLHEKQSVLCWQKNGQTYLSFFIVWW